MMRTLFNSGVGIKEWGIFALMKALEFIFDVAV
jgi:hypothetical protein